VAKIRVDSDKKWSHDISEVLSQYYLRGAEYNHEESQDIHCHGFSQMGVTVILALSA
jgi:thiamine phosphate synthase YjbQ (UPF0047 family)